MGLHDRSYARGDQSSVRSGRAGGGARFGPRLWSLTTWLIVINAAVFLIEPMLSRAGVPVLVDALNAPGFEPHPTLRRQENNAPADPSDQRIVGTQMYQPLWNPATGQVLADPNGMPVAGRTFTVSDPLYAFGHFSTYTGFQQLQVWRLVTFQFLHSGVMHLALNMLGLYMFGPIVEEHLGKRKYLAFYLTCGIFGGLTYLVLNLAGWFSTLYLKLPPLPALLVNQPMTSLIGASAGVFGIIMACARIRPNETVMLAFPPVSLPMKYCAYGYVAIAAFNLLFNTHAPGGNAGGDAAHIGGALAGFFFIKHSHLLTDFFDVLSDSRRVKARAAKATSGTDGEVDRVLAKVATQGLQSLSEGEKRILSSETQRQQRRSRSA